MTMEMAPVEGLPVPAHVAPERIYQFDMYNDVRLADDVHDSCYAVTEGAPPVFYTPANGGHWVVSRHQELFDVLRDTEHFSNREQQIPRVPQPPVFIPLSLDPPDNFPFRQALMPYFSAAPIKAMEERVREFAVEIIERIAPRGGCDFVAEVGAPFPISVFMELMGLPPERFDEFRALAETYFAAQTPEEYAPAIAAIVETMTDLLLYRKENPGPGIISEMHNFDIRGRPMTLPEMQSMASLLFLGGMDTVANVSSYIYRYLASRPDLQDRLRDAPELIPAFVEEGIAMFGVINTPRFVVKDCEKFGVRFKAGDMMLCLLPMAGRDEKRFSDAAELDLDRKRRDHLTFSAGPHLCIGHILARLEIRVLTEEWMRRIPSFRWKAGEAHPNRLGGVFALECLPLEWDLPDAA